MKKFLRHKTFDEVVSLCKARGIPVNVKRYVEDGHDHIVVGQPWPLDPNKPHVIYNTFNGKFFGVAADGTKFDSMERKHEAEPWFQALLSFLMVDRGTFYHLLDVMRAKATTDDEKALVSLFTKHNGKLSEHFDDCMAFAKGDHYGTGYTFHKGFRQYDVLPTARDDMVVWNALSNGRSLFWAAYHELFPIEWKAAA